MTIEQLVPTLETCKRLKEAGFPQDTYVTWTRTAFASADRENYVPCRYDWRNDLLDDWLDPIAAPTAAEIGKWLPYAIRLPWVREDGTPTGERSSPGSLAISKSAANWQVFYDFDERYHCGVISRADSMVEAMALMLLDLVQRGLVTFDKQEAGADA